jgi:hypothetical protein
MEAVTGTGKIILCPTSDKIFSGEAPMWLVSIAAFAQALSTLDSPSAQLAHPLAQAARVLFSHVLLPLLQANHEL